MQENIKAKLEEKKAGDIHLKFKSGLEQALSATSSLVSKIKSLVNGRAAALRLTKHTAELGLLFLNELPAYREENWRYSKEVKYFSKRYKRIRELLGSDEWNDTNNYNLLMYFFGEEKAKYVRYAWQHIRYQMYQTGYLRRSFRSPNNPEMYFTNQINFIVNLIPQSHNQTTTYHPEYKQVYTCYDLSITEQIICAHYIGDTNQSLFMLWSAAIDAGDKEVYQLAEDIIFNKDEEGKVTRSLIKTLLNSEKQEAWQLVEKLLLAAQRQEGLRQTVLEALDETSIGALKYIIRVIIDNHLARFSSVVRSVDVWAGLGWESEREATVRNFLEKAYKYLHDPAAIPPAIKSENNADVYMALWAQGVYDIEETIPLLQQLYKEGNAEKRTLALLFAGITGHYKIRMPFFYPALADEDLQPLACAANSIYQALQLGENDKYYNEHFPGLFDALHNAYKKIAVKEKTFESYIFSWAKIKFERKILLLSMLRLVNNEQRLNTVLQYFDEMDATAKRQLTSKILPAFSRYAYEKKQDENVPLTAFQRDYAMRILKDRSEYEIAFKALSNEIFSIDEANVFPELLKRKAAGFRNGIIALLLKQRDKIIKPVIEEVLQGDPEQRLASLDILLQLQNSKRLTAEIKLLASAFRERKNISQKEEILLTQLTGEEDAKDISAKNGYGLFNPDNMSPIVKPAINPSNVYEKFYNQYEYAFSMPYTDIKKALNSLAEIYMQHKDYEYEIEYWDNSRQTVLLGNEFRKKSFKSENLTNAEAYATYPLPEVWEEWYHRSALQPQDLLIIHLSAYSNTSLKQLPDYTNFNPELFKSLSSYFHPLYRVIEALMLIHPYEKANEFLLGATTRLFASLDKKTLTSTINENCYYPRGNGWQQMEHLNIFLKNINLYTIPDELIKDCWNIYNWRQFSGIAEAIEYSFPPLIIFCRAYKLNIITQDEMYRGIMNRGSIELLSSRKHHKNSYDFFKGFSFSKPMFDKALNYILDIELKRGDSDTQLTLLASSIQSIYGIRRFTEILAGLGKTSLYKGYFYSFNDSGKNKQELFSKLLKHCYPLSEDTQDIFNDSIQRIKASETKLIEAAVYAPQWQKFISNYLGWKGLDSAIWWMHAHTKTNDYRAQNIEAESEIAKYSSVDIQEFKDGAVDKEWFLKAYKEIGKLRWQLVYNAAKYISDGNGHRRARIYADVLLGELSMKDITEKISSKRDQDFVRIYGLAPLAKKNLAKDVLSRYEFLQKFKKESRQFGAQKQASETLALRIAMENLARNAGYSDPIRLTWAMETKQVQHILSKQTQVQYDDVLIGLIINEDGEAKVVSFKGEKELKAVPAKFKKDSNVEELFEFKKILREQFRRSRKGLEDAMIRGDVFLFDEIKNLFTHPVIAKHFIKLVLVASDESNNQVTGFYKDEKLVDANGSEIILTDKHQLRIAHCVDLFHSKQWAAYQHYAFDKKIQQPFKQIFRELYLPTQDELKEKSVSRRYAGNQVQPKQTAALLRSRGWKADYEEGLQKVFHKEGFVAKIFAMADWFSPAEVEAPTLEIIEFHDLKTSKNIDFTSINERIFSEIMRDIDLVVSVAHVGGVDPQASHSSIEMRSVLLTETLRLFKINNVTISGSHAKIKGTFGEYSVHLGSAVVNKIASGYLSILPVHSQHRGRLFLPFIDDDPKSAEVISKVLLLARDKDIQDPTILSQLN